MSPRLQVRFAISEDNLEIYRPDGQNFLTTLELNQYADQEYERAERLLSQLRAA